MCARSLFWTLNSEASVFIKATSCFCWVLLLFPSWLEISGLILVPRKQPHHHIWASEGGDCPVTVLLCCEGHSHIPSDQQMGRTWPWALYYSAFAFWILLTLKTHCLQPGGSQISQEGQPVVFSPSTTSTVGFPLWCRRSKYITHHSKCQTDKHMHSSGPGE